MFKVIRMNLKWLYIVVLLLMVGCQPAEISANKLGLQGNEALAEVKLDKQLKVNKDALLSGSSEQIRIDAASVIIFSEEPLARKVLLEILKASGNKASRAAICKALSQGRAEQKKIKDKSDFIPPLFDILNTEGNDLAKLAAEATLIFEYKQIQRQLENMVSDSSRPVKAKLNAIYALRLQPDMRAIFKLVDLVDDSEIQVAIEAEKALQSLGIPVGKDARARRQIKDELSRKGRDAFLRDWLIRQEAQVRNLEAERDFWQKQYLVSLGTIYDGIGDDVARGKFLAGHLSSSETILRLWALEKVSQWRVGTKSKFPAELGPVLVGLISDQNRNVRLKTAKLLSLMGELNSSEKLLEQLKIEHDDEVRTELFVALGGACYYAFSPNSGVKLASEVKKQTFEWAAKYLSEEESKRAQKGAEVMKRMLSQNGLSSGEVNKYLGLLAERYRQEEDNTEESLRGELLGLIAGLCAQNIYKAESVKVFKPLFEEAMDDKTDLVREAAVSGLIYIDKTKALERLGVDAFVNDSSIVIRKKLIELAGEVGGEDDLVWLSGKIGSNSEDEPAWRAMLKIFKRSEIAVLEEWLAKFDSEGAKPKLADEQMISFLEITERKAIGENKLAILKGIREKLAFLYSKNNEFELAAEYLGMLRKVAQTDDEKRAILGDLLDVYLRWPNIEGMSHLVSNFLLEKDLEPDSVIMISLDRYLAEPPAGADPNGVLEALVYKIAPQQARPKWSEQVKRWAERLGKAEEPNEPKTGG